MYNYPDGMTGREFDTIECDVICPGCQQEWTQEVSSSYGRPVEFDTECEECGRVFTAYVRNYY